MRASMGADGGIGSNYNLMAGRCVKLHESYLANDTAAAAAMQQKLSSATKSFGPAVTQDCLMKHKRRANQ